ncbi:MAG TPA: hypothetical protein VLV54_07790 [Thermoanaerobaculia bacterium]|nr:hypothetical protein [Thermoanaerobaculia bacterium]
MSRIPLVPSVVLLLLVLLFVAAPFASAAAPPGRTIRSAVSPLEASASLSQIWSWLTGGWGKNGCMIDPNGRCLPGTGATPAPPASPATSPGGQRLGPLRELT